MGRLGAASREESNLSVHLNVVQIQGLGNDGKRHPTLISPAQQVGDEMTLGVIATRTSQGDELAIDQRPGTDQLIRGGNRRKRRLGQVVTHALVPQLMAKHRPRRPSGPMA